MDGKKARAKDLKNAREEHLKGAARVLTKEIAAFSFSDPVAFVYNPLDYAWEMYARYIDLYGKPRKRVLFLGMNPGPWGMAQTGIPFGEISFVRNWLKIEEPIGAPPAEHPKRKITGLSCGRSEVSGRRLWSLFSKHSRSAEAFFADHFVANYCPLLFVEETGRNRTPDKLPADQRSRLFEACDRHLMRTIEILQPEWLIGIGGFAEKRLIAAQSTVSGGGAASAPSAKIGKILHPSPASPAANKGWEKTAESQLRELGVWK